MSHIGTDALGMVLVVVNTVRGEHVRVISARAFSAKLQKEWGGANKRERKEYQQ